MAPPGVREKDHQQKTQHRHAAEDRSRADEQAAHPLIQIAVIVGMADIALIAVIGTVLPQNHLHNLVAKQYTHHRMSQLVDRCADEGGGHADLIAAAPEQPDVQLQTNPGEITADQNGRQRVQRDSDVIPNEPHNSTPSQKRID